MKLKADIHILNRDAEDVKAGEIIFDGEKITTSSNDKLLVRMASIPIEVNWSGEYIDPEREPERFVRNLWQHYFSPYLRAMKARIAVVAVLAVAAMALIGTTATAMAGIDGADLALAAARLSAATERPEPCNWQYVRNSDLPPDAVELAPEEQVQPERFYQAPPIERPQGVPDDFVPVRVFQSREDEGWKFWGWILLPLKNVRELHENLATI